MVYTGTILSDFVDATLTGDSTHRQMTAEPCKHYTIPTQNGYDSIHRPSGKWGEDAFITNAAESSKWIIIYSVYDEMVEESNGL